MGPGHHPEQRAHRRCIGQPHPCRLDLRRARGRCAGQLLGARIDAQLAQEIALPHRAMHPQPRLSRHIADDAEIDMGGQVHLARIGKGVGELVRLDGLERVPQQRPFIAIVDDDRRPALLGDALRQGIGDASADDRRFDDRAILRLRGDRRQARFDPTIAGDGQKRGVRLAPSCPGYSTARRGRRDGA